MRTAGLRARLRRGRSGLDRSGSEGAGATLEWEGNTFMRAPSLEQPLQMSEPPRLPEMNLPATIREEACAGTAVSAPRRKSLLGVIENGTVLVSADVLLSHGGEVIHPQLKP